MCYMNVYWEELVKSDGIILKMIELSVLYDIS